MRTFVVLALVVVASSAPAQEWTRFRGPNGVGISATELPIQWTEKNRLWKVAIPGRGYSSPILWQDHIYLTAGNSGKRLVYCVDAATGKTLWQRDFDAKTYK